MILKELDIELGGLLLKHREINKSLLSLKYGVDRHTIARHLKSIENKKRKKRECGLLKYYDIIKEKLIIQQVMKKLVHIQISSNMSKDTLKKLE